MHSFFLFFCEVSTYINDDLGQIWFQSGVWESPLVFQNTMLLSNVHTPLKDATQCFSSALCDSFYTMAIYTECQRQVTMKENKSKTLVYWFVEYLIIQDSIVLWCRGVDLVLAFSRFVFQTVTYTLKVGIMSFFSATKENSDFVIHRRMEVIWVWNNIRTFWWTTVSLVNETIPSNLFHCAFQLELLYLFM